MNSILYPIKFDPILKDKIWGGSKLTEKLNKVSDLNNLGESWEISDVDGDTSIVSNGSLKGKSLQELLVRFGADILGQKNHETFGNKFPLLIKFIDAKQDLSIQLHPNDQLAAERHNSFGKTEMWYVMQADDDANLIVGFNKKVTPQEYLKHLEDKTLTKILNFEEVKEGDTYFIEVGRVHAIGAGVMLAEIQQTSDITYRVYDWDRVDDEGNARELHNDLAIDAIDFNMEDNFKVDYAKDTNVSNLMVDCPYFKTSFLDLDQPVKKKNVKDSFYIYMCVDGTAEIETDNYALNVSKGETVLVPASIKSYRINTNKAKFLEVYV